MLGHQQIAGIVSRYDTKNVTIGALGSHSALEVMDGAKDEGIRTVCICQKGRDLPYRRFSRLTDEIILLDKFSDVLNRENKSRTSLVGIVRLSLFGGRIEEDRRSAGILQERQFTRRSHPARTRRRRGARRGRDRARRRHARHPTAESPLARRRVEPVRRVPDRFSRRPRISRRSRAQVARLMRYMLDTRSPIATKNPPRASQSLWACAAPLCTSAGSSGPATTAEADGDDQQAGLRRIGHSGTRCRFHAAIV